MTESFEDLVERCAKAWVEKPCPPEEGPCNAFLHVWEDAQEEDKEWARETARVMLTEAGLG